MNNIHLLPLPARPAAIFDQSPILPGYRYPMTMTESTQAEHAKAISDVDQALQTGLIGAYRLGVNSARLDPIDVMAQPPQGFVWEPGLLSPELRSRIQIAPEQPRSPLHNHLTLIEASLNAPEVRVCDSHPVLTISPRLELEWATDSFSSQLGLVQLVESSRTLQFEDGESLALLDTEAEGVGPVLYLSDATGAVAVKPLCAFQQQGDMRRLSVYSEVTQSVPAEIKGKAVASVSVLEKYTWYLMQNADPDDMERHIWVPVHLPIVWGWSIRVQQRFDGVWDIFRKKLIMPAPSTEAPALPRWQSNTLNCRRALLI
ncbi:MAG: hypothetical protein LUQ11_02930 [Methylococcaceae bacterium]|nr:hypothetical protein [Methylococcaceae bacterium]